MTATESKGYWVYIARMKDGRLYVGHTNSIPRRSSDHGQGDGSRTTRIFGFDDIVHAERHSELTSAVRRERQLKGWTHAKKLALASGDLRYLKRLSRSRQRRAGREGRS